MKDYLKSIQSLPESKRKIIFWVIIVLVGLVFLSFWAKTVKDKFAEFDSGKLAQKLDIDKIEENVDNFKAVGKQLGEIENQLKSLNIEQTVTPSI